MLPNQLDLVTAAAVLRWRQRTCRLTLFVSGSGRGGNYCGDGIGNRSGGAAATKTDAVAHGCDGNRGSGGGNIEAVEPATEK